jgi:hypothetical protein
MATRVEGIVVDEFLQLNPEWVFPFNKKKKIACVALLMWAALSVFSVFSALSILSGFSPQEH